MGLNNEVANLKERHCTVLCKTAFFFVLLVILLYGHTLNSPWQLDDYQNIVQNPNIQMSRIDLSSIKNSFYAAPPSYKRLDRPIAFFSFALNWWWDKDNVTGYHVVNITIHLLTSFILFCTILLLFQTPNGKAIGQDDVYPVALLSATLWLIHPIQIQAVTYIVQRMAELAAFFSIVGIYCYVKARLTKKTLQKTVCFVVCGIAFLLGVGSKSNAFLLPFSLILIEFTFFQDLKRKRTRNQAALVFGGCVVVIVTAGVILFMNGRVSSIIDGYGIRPFTIWERLMTQPRVLFFYLSQIFYPVASRFSVVHDVITSTSLANPWTTLPSILAILGGVSFALWGLTRRPILSFGILFFLGNHLIESSIIPLEMIFEHRNYLPSLFLFLPLSLAIVKGLEFYRSNQKTMYWFLWCSVFLVLMGIGISTYLRNTQWQSIPKLWEDARKKAPKSARPLQTLGWYYGGIGKVKPAIALYKRSLELNFDRTYYRSIPYNNLAGIYFSKLADYKAALYYARKAVDEYTGLTHANIILCKSLGNLGRYEEAMERLDHLLADYPDHRDYLYLKGYFLLKQAKPKIALEYFRKCLSLSPDNWVYLREIGFCYNQLKQYDKAYWFIRRADRFHADHAGILTAAIDNRLKAGDTGSAKDWVHRLIGVVGNDQIDAYLRRQSEDPMSLPLDYGAVAMLVTENLRNLGRRYVETASGLRSHFHEQ
jgi:protein O-mannosyl-transferase